MFAVISCKKYNRKTLRVADFGDSVTTVEEADAVVAGLPNFECPVCGPFSHVEFNWDNYLTVHSIHDTEDKAVGAAVALNESMPDSYKLEIPV